MLLIHFYLCFRAPINAIQICSIFSYRSIHIHVLSFTAIFMHALSFKLQILNQQATDLLPILKKAIQYHFVGQHARITMHWRLLYKSIMHSRPHWLSLKPNTHIGRIQKACSPLGEIVQQKMFIFCYDDLRSIFQLYFCLYNG